ncbi:MAG: aspartate-semialdehyde dehydrogenase [Clostridia bacterium]|nr:aspartate-semialdehyde dehydrogenase [Clostridia bacterium]
MITCAIIGASGLVGSTFLKVLEEKKLPIDEFFLFASKRSAGKKVKLLGKQYSIQELTEDTPKEKFTYAMFFAGGKISKDFAPKFAENGTIVIDNSSAFRMDENIPLVVPEVNITKAIDAKIIANPNCSTIQAVVPLKVIHDKYKIKRIVYSTYQAVSGAGQKGIEDFKLTSVGLEHQKFPHKIYNNCIPQIDDFVETGYTKEELKMINETHKILDDYTINITATCVRVPVLNCHSESINIELENEFDIDELKQLLNKTEGIIVMDDTRFNIYPLNEKADGIDDILVGRIRRDFSVKNGINMWVVADNIRKGAASNAAQILEYLLSHS